jgi:LPPG:FO 2-phospho-L-lactate transferase
MIVVLTGGTGGAKLVDGLRQALPPRDLTLIVNTGDDLEWWGLAVSPDLDSITYVLAGLLSRERGWGVQDDTFLCLQMMARLGRPAWFQIGDRDLATHLLRSQLLQAGKTLSEATAEIAARFGVGARILPMSDAPVQTRVETPAGELSFEEYFVERHFEDPVRAVRFAGAADALPAPGVIDAILSATAVILAPSNPVTSIGPILAVPGIRQALRETRARVAAVSPIVGGAAVSGPAGALMATLGVPVSIAGIAQLYEDFLDILVVDRSDQPAAQALEGSSLRVHSTNTMMRSASDKVELARSVLSLFSREHPRSQEHPPSKPGGELAGRSQPAAQGVEALDQAQPGRSESKRGAPGTGLPMILIPVKNLAHAKQRLAALLEPAARTALAQAMLLDVLETLDAWPNRPAIGIVTSDPFARGVARRFALEVIPDYDNRGETDAIEMATELCRARGVSSTLVIPADIPLLTVAEMEAILAAAPREGSVLVPAADGRGTNAAYRSPAALFPLRFGNDSFKPHLAAARATGKPCVLLSLPGIALDVDNPAELQQLASAPGETRSQRLARRWGFAEWPRAASE